MLCVLLNLLWPIGCIVFISHYVVLQCCTAASYKMLVHDAHTDTMWCCWCTYIMHPQSTYMYMITITTISHTIEWEDSKEAYMAHGILKLHVHIIHLIRYNGNTRRVEICKLQKLYRRKVKINLHKYKTNIGSTNLVLWNYPLD